MSALERFGRAANLVVENAIISASIDKTAVGQVSLLRFSFRIVKTLTADPNTAEITIFNLSEQSRAALQKKGIDVALEAGYKSNTEIIFKGQSSKIEHRHEGPDWASKISCGDGEKSLRGSQISKGWGPNTKVTDVAKDLANALGLGGGNLESQLSKLAKGGFSQFTNGFAADGQASKAFDKLLGGLGVGWSIQDGQVQLLKDDEALTDPAITIESEQLLGRPEAGEKSDKAKEKGPVFRCKVLLEPGLKPGRRVTMKAQGLKGSFRCERVEHVGDTWGTEWYTQFDAKPVQT